MKKGELRRTDITDTNNEFKRSGNISVPNDESVSWLKKVHHAFACITVEPILFFYVFSNSICNIAVQTLNSEKACLVDLNYTKKDCDEWDGQIATEVYNAIKDMKSWQEPFESGVSVIALLFLGAWSDRTGQRKALIFLPVFARMLSSFGLVLTTFFFTEFSVFVNGLIISLPIALSGGYYMALIGSFSHLADITSLKSRTLRIGIAIVFASSGAPPAIYIYETLKNKIDFLGLKGLKLIFVLDTVVYMTGLLYIYFRIHDKKTIKIEGSWGKKMIKFLDPSNAWDTLSMPFKSDPHRTKILLLIAAYVVIIGPVFGEGFLLYEYLADKVGMHHEDVGLFVNYSIQISTCGTLIAVLFFSKFLQVHDAILGIIALTCKVMSCFVYAFASDKLWLYSGPFFDLFGGSGVTVVKSLATKVVAPDQIAKMGSMIGLIEMVIPMMFTSIYNQMYENTKNTIIPGAYYLLGVALMTPVFFIFGILYMQCKEEERDRVTDPEGEQLYAHDNYITKF